MESVEADAEAVLLGEFVAVEPAVVFVLLGVLVAVEPNVEFVLGVLMPVESEVGLVPPGELGVLDVVEPVEELESVVGSERD